jgi:hypothetical protein
MTSDDGIFLGFDPGGDRKFGVAFFEGDRITASTESNVDDAMRWSLDMCGSRKPIAAGIDTLLHWATGGSSMRPCDLQLRMSFPLARNSIMAPNSLRGAMAIGGMALALRLHRAWPELILNETHPKVLLHALGVQRYDPLAIEPTIQWFVERARCAEWSIKGEHAFDAALSAWATREGISPYYSPHTRDSLADVA